MFYILKCVKNCDKIMEQRECVYIYSHIQNVIFIYIPRLVNGLLPCHRIYDSSAQEDHIPANKYKISTCQKKTMHRKPLNIFQIYNQNEIITK